MIASKYPSLYQLNTRVVVNRLGRELNRRATLDDIPDSELDAIAGCGFDWVYLLSVWQTGEAGRQVSRSNALWLEEFRAQLPDLEPADIAGSGFAITGYEVSRDLGDDSALLRFKERLSGRQMRLMLDFVPNHTAIDHRWVTEHPDFYIVGDAQKLAAQPHNYIKMLGGGSERILACGRDPYFDGWRDTLQLNYANAKVQKAMIEQLEQVSRLCDGVRCDMAMLLLPEVFQRTWGIQPSSFWDKAIDQIKAESPKFVFLAEVYWSLEWTMQQLGFDYTYDKTLYDRLRAGSAQSVRQHFWAQSDYQNKCARFLENHDEARAASVFSDPVQKAAAVLTFLSPGMRFFHDGQQLGAKLRQSVHLIRSAIEPVDLSIREFYQELFLCMQLSVLRNGSWSLLECAPAWSDNSTADSVIAFHWSDKSEQEAVVVVVNFSDNQSQCRIPLPLPSFATGDCLLHDRLNNCTYQRSCQEMRGQGLYIDLRAWRYHCFQMDLSSLAVTNRLSANIKQT